MRKIYLAAAMLIVFVGTATAKEATTSKSVLACAEQDAYRKFSRQVQEAGDDKKALADAVFSGRCRIFDTGTIFVIEKSEGEVLVRVHVKGSKDQFWTSRLFLE